MGCFIACCTKLLFLHITHANTMHNAWCCSFFQLWLPWQAHLAVDETWQQKFAKFWLLSWWWEPNRWCQVWQISMAWSVVLFYNEDLLEKNWIFSLFTDSVHANICTVLKLLSKVNLILHSFTQQRPRSWWQINKTNINSRQKPKETLLIKTPSNITVLKSPAKKSSAASLSAAS